MTSKQVQRRVSSGVPHPLGAVADDGGVNFSVFSQNATAVELLLFDGADCIEPSQVIAFDRDSNRSFYLWHAYVHGLRPGTHYAYRVDGPRDVGSGHHFDPDKLLVDPYARGIYSGLWQRGAACGPGDNLATSMRAVVTDVDDYDWEGDRILGRPMSETIIYEMHVRGFTNAPNSGVKYPGTFAGVTEKLPYLQELGVTALELLPVFHFDHQELSKPSPVDGSLLTNYWGYSTLGFFAPDDQYCIEPESGTHLHEFRDMVKACHKAGIEVILDVVFNHTSEGNHLGPTVSFKGFDNATYYYTVPDDRQYYMDYSGCGNTVNCNHPAVEKLILDCLRFWVEKMHVDGFRFDEGSVLTRGEDGAPMVHPPVIWSIELSEELLDTKVVAEAWDAAGLYQVGYFPGYRWAEWNGRYRDTVRRFVRGDPGLLGDVADRLAGSADLYQHGGRAPINSVNFVTCHDGFTLNDLVSYDGKHNDANGEGNRDGNDDNMSSNSGWEGPSTDPDLELFRSRQVKNFAAILLLSQGVPMISMGDEVRRTQDGNNNAYCQDNQLSWFDWQQVDRHADVLRFFQQMVALRKSHPVLHRSRFFTGERNERDVPDLVWHGCALESPGWDDPSGRALAFTLGALEGEHDDLHVILNMSDDALDFELPPVEGRAWWRAVDTALPPPYDIAEPGSEQLVNGPTYLATGRSVVVLTSK
jgi:isoamylase